MYICLCMLCRSILFDVFMFFGSTQAQHEKKGAAKLLLDLISEMLRVGVYDEIGDGIMTVYFSFALNYRVLSES